MKKLLISLMILMVSIASIAQEWKIYHQTSDGLKGTSDKDVPMYMIGDSYNVLNLLDEKTFILGSQGKILEIEEMYYSTPITTAKVGLYDESMNLIKTLKIPCSIRKGLTAVLTYGGKKVIHYLENEKGYVRFILPLSSTNEDYDITIPTIPTWLNNPTNH